MFLVRSDSPQCHRCYSRKLFKSDVTEENASLLRLSILKSRPLHIALFIFYPFPPCLTLSAAALLIFGLCSRDLWNSQSSTSKVRFSRPDSVLKAPLVARNLCFLADLVGSFWHFLCACISIRPSVRPPICPSDTWMDQVTYTLFQYLFPCLYHLQSIFDFSMVHTFWYKPTKSFFGEFLSFSLSLSFSLLLSPPHLSLSFPHAEKPLCKITVQFWKVETGSRQFRSSASATMECWPWWWLLSNGGSTIGFSETKGLLSGLTGGNAHT